MSKIARVSIVLPSRNEGVSLATLLPSIRKHVPGAEILVVDDGSTDDTADLCDAHQVTRVAHPYPKGNGAAIKSGARAASGNIIVFMDADGQHQPADIPRLLAKLDEGYDMVVGSRNSDDHAGAHRGFANGVFNRFASWMVNHPVPDLTSGFRAVRADCFRRFLYLLPNSFSYPTTSTMSFFRAGLSVAYVPVRMPPRIGDSHIRPLRDGIRFLLIILKIGTLYSPLKLFLPVSLLLLLSGACYYGYTFWMFNRFTNMSALLFSTAVIVFMMGLISEQITMLNYRDSDRD